MNPLPRLNPSRHPGNSTESIVSRVADQSSLARKYDRKLDQFREHWRGREAEYLGEVHRRFGEHLSWLRWEIYNFTGVDILTKKTAPGGERSPVDAASLDYVANLYADRDDILRICFMLDRAGKMADRYGRSPEEEQFETFFWAMKYCTVAETVFLTEKLEGDKEKQLTIEHLAGWVDVRTNLNGPQASRLIRGLGVGRAHARDALREQLPAAVVIAMQDWKPGKELPENDRPIVSLDKQTAGRQPRSFKSRALRQLEAKIALQECSIDDITKENYNRIASNGYGKQFISTLSQDSIAMARASQMESEEWAKSQWTDLLADFADSGILGPNERRLALHLSENADLLPERNGKVRMQYGGHKLIAQQFGSSAGQIRVEFHRMMRKLKDFAGSRSEEPANGAYFP